MNHLMIDIETMGVKQNATIVSIGAVFLILLAVSWDRNFTRLSPLKVQSMAALFQTPNDYVVDAAKRRSSNGHL